ncbi:hypothetical protein CSCA_0735 [Clostridium scatologenes]|uniref:Uncharacterized protein n=1 Tax=Clostridium scatologenes TaxID=1548 RepID=A0A0E3JMB3_CLOSL|nr:hypothetical protein CSCA_0735 [Clostridium scatologenes]
MIVNLNQNIKTMLRKKFRKTEEGKTPNKKFLVRINAAI